MNENIEDVKRDIANHLLEQARSIACTAESIDAFWGEGPTLVCICSDPEVAPWKRCPIHDAAVD